MRTDPRCPECFLRGAVDTARLLGLPAEAQASFLADARCLIAGHDEARCPPELGRSIQRRLRAVAGPDPYQRIKEESNALAWRLLPEIERIVAAAEDPFEAALRYAIAGNCIDFGKGHGIGPREVAATLERCATQRLDAAVVSHARRLCHAAQHIVYLADNAGEIVFDRLLLSRLPQGRVTVLVRGSPVINDATRADAEVARIEDFARVLDNGSDAPGTVLTDVSPTALQEIMGADLIIAKGQGNYESLQVHDVDVLFLLLVKCPVVAQQTGLPEGHPAIIHDPGPLSQELGLFR